MGNRSFYATAWSSHAKTTVVMDSEESHTGKIIIAECRTEEHAALLAAAPDLLAALVKCDDAMAYMSEYDIPLCLPSDVKEAIAKATGKAA